MAKPGVLYLIPVPISDDMGVEQMPAHNISVVSSLRNFVAEHEKTARRYLKLFGYPDQAAARIVQLNEHTVPEERSAMLVPIEQGEDVGLMSDAGCPGVADPGAGLVAACHSKGIKVVPLVGPSSILLAVMSSGMNGQNFAFTGYLPVDKQDRSRRLRHLEQLAEKEGQAQFFIETPYRNIQMFESMLSVLSSETKVFVGADIGAENAFILTRTIAEWRRQQKPALHKVPVVFGIFR